MGYVVYEVRSGRIVNDRQRDSYREYKNEAAARACLTRLTRKHGYWPHQLAVSTVDQVPKRSRRVRNLMSGQTVEIDVNTPHCCDPSTETFWSM